MASPEDAGWVLTGVSSATIPTPLVIINPNICDLCKELMTEVGQAIDDGYICSSCIERVAMEFMKGNTDA